MTENPQSLKVSLEDLAEVANSEPDKVSVQAQPASLSPAGKSYGNVNTAPDAPAVAQEKGSILLQGWFYLGVAGTLGSLAGWGIAEPGFVDGPRNGSHWGDVLMVPLVVTLMCVGFAVAESIVERSTRKALIRGGLALPLGMVLGFLIANLANVFYSVGLSICRAAGVLTFHNPATWIVRGLAWMVLGAAGGIIYGIIGQSMKKTGYGALGGAIGALLGGTVFRSYLLRNPWRSGQPRSRVRASGHGHWHCNRPGGKRSERSLAPCNRGTFGRKTIYLVQAAHCCR